MPRVQITIPFLGTNHHFLYKTIKERKEFHYGIGNRCEDGKYVLFLDYDDTPDEWIREEIKLLQDNTQLGTAYIFQTKNGCHVLFLEKFYLAEILKLMNMTSIDPRYKNVPLQYGKKLWVLRSSNKKNETIKYLGYKYKLSPLERSRAHATYLTRILGIPRDHLAMDESPLDTSTGVVLGHYKIHRANN